AVAGAVFFVGSVGGRDYSDRRFSSAEKDVATGNLQRRGYCDSGAIGRSASMGSQVSTNEAKSDGNGFHVNRDEALRLRWRFRNQLHLRRPRGKWRRCAR